MKIPCPIIPLSEAKSNITIYKNGKMNFPVILFAVTCTAAAGKKIVYIYILYTHRCGIGKQKKNERTNEEITREQYYIGG